MNNNQHSSTHQQMLQDQAVALIEQGEVIPVDLEAHLIEGGIDVNGLRELNAQTNHDNCEDSQWTN